MNQHKTMAGIEKELKRRSSYYYFDKLRKLAPELFSSEVKRAPRNYEEFQCISYSPSTEIRNNYYKGLEDDSLDWKKRLEILKNALNEANKDSGVNKTSNCLKIFMIPEFYFRGEKGAYEMTDISDLTDGLRELASDDKYKDWMFVFWPEADVR